MIFIFVSLNEYLLARGCLCFLIVIHVILYMNGYLEASNKNKSQKYRESKKYKKVIISLEVILVKKLHTILIIT